MSASQTSREETRGPGHTPGPWKLGGAECNWTADYEGRAKDGVSTSQPISAEGKVLALAVWEGWDDREGDANVALISAAPDLLAALRYALRFLNADDHDVQYVVDAIAKAEGRL